MALKARDAIWILIFITSLFVGQMFMMGTAPAHEFGHYAVAKYFNWNITEVDWFSYVECSKDTFNNASHIQKILVGIAGILFSLPVPYIIYIKSKNKIFKVIGSSYLIIGFCASTADIKMVCASLIQQLFGISVPVDKFTIGSPINLISTVITVVIFLFVVNESMKIFGRHVTDLCDLIIDLDDNQEDGLNEV